MTCDSCGKKQATVHYTEIHNGDMTELHLCEDCARKQEVDLKQHFSLADLLAGLGDFEEAIPMEVSREKCPVCGMTLTDFRKLGRLGCGGCYRAFQDSLTPLLKRIHGKASHTGKAAGIKDTGAMQKLKKSLQDAVLKEEFEEAARIRDKIKEFEKKEK